MSYLHENINDLKITPSASQAEIEYTNRHNVIFCENIYDIIVYMWPKLKVLKHCSLFKKPVRIWEFFSFFDKNMTILINQYSLGQHFYHFWFIKLMRAGMGPSKEKIKSLLLDLGDIKIC